MISVNICIDMTIKFWRILITNHIYLVWLVKYFLKNKLLVMIPAYHTVIIYLKRLQINTHLQVYQNDKLFTILLPD